VVDILRKSEISLTSWTCWFNGRKINFCKV